MYELSKKKLYNAFVVPGLRVHTSPKVATWAILEAMPGARHAIVSEPGSELRLMVVRHPLDRLVSAWSFFCQADDNIRIGGEPNLLKLGYFLGMPFDRFVDICCQTHDQNVHTHRQIHFKGPHQMDALIPLPHLNEAWEGLRDRFPVLPMTHNHRSDHGPWEAYYTHRTRDMAEQVYAPDVALYEQALTFIHTGEHPW